MSDTLPLQRSCRWHLEALNFMLNIIFNRGCSTGVCSLPFVMGCKDLWWSSVYASRASVQRLSVPTQAVGFAVDVRMIIAFHHTDKVEIYTNETIWMIKPWVEGFALKLAEYEPKLVHCSKWQKWKTVQICISAYIIRSQPSQTYILESNFRLQAKL